MDLFDLLMTLVFGPYSFFIGMFFLLRVTFGYVVDVYKFMSWFGFIGSASLVYLIAELITIAESAGV